MIHCPGREATQLMPKKPAKKKVKPPAPKKRVFPPAKKPDFIRPDPASIVR